MIVSINQPGYLPWLGYFDRIARSDLHIVLDHVQFEKNSFTNRNKIRSGSGWTWLTVPVRTKGKFNDLPINGIAIDKTRPWARKHRDSLRLEYSKAPYFERYWSWLEAQYERPWECLGDLLRELNDFLLRELNVDTKLIYSSDLGVAGRKDDLVLNLCSEVGATTYLSGPLGRDYLHPYRFREAGIALEFHDYVHPRYGQVHKDFLPNMSVIDLLLNQGPKAGEIMYNDSGGE